tara:strand:- start:368 stop:568 length:201 start_codon:yes stop_codon:yes gene_type:complete
MSEIIFISIGLVLIIEGILYFLLANNLNKLLNIISAINPQTIKNISAFCALMGLCLIYFTFKFYDN